MTVTNIDDLDLNLGSFEGQEAIVSKNTTKFLISRLQHSSVT